eukprot:CAMPEP_0178472578 /NCGR_PEP_ID=MMETSP0696-20121128/1641_1 /TAXON_ID=265572 /ORGANISM="Extubocellulus spinifer, Strain CCMP396" /LENGTH=327 /DNA_ID=CAMNT_0020099769 /DNA_START=64 /DNA_END=1044 /DNA_ORIENTATION=+
MRSMLMLYAALLLQQMPLLCVAFLQEGVSIRVAAPSRTGILIQHESSPTGAATADATNNSSNNNKGEDVPTPEVEAQVVCPSTDLKDELFDLAASTERGFKASREQRKRVQDIVKKLAELNPTGEPASSYYEGNNNSGPALDDATADLAGKWTLMYTDAPDIISLDSGGLGPIPSAAKLGRIGQECSPPYIKNVIEWTKPEFVKSLSLPFSGSDEDRILQKVVCEASATPADPTVVDLKLVGLDIVGDRGADNEDDSADGDNDDNILRRIQAGPAGLIGSTPLELRGFLTAPFGKFTVKYLDEELRIIETYQGYLAINRRQTPGEEW